MAPRHRMDTWNRLDPATAILEAGETLHYLLVTERELLELKEGVVMPAVKVRCLEALITLEQDCERWARERAEAKA